MQTVVLARCLLAWTKIVLSFGPACLPGIWVLLKHPETWFPPAFEEDAKSRSCLDPANVLCSKSCSCLGPIRFLQLASLRVARKRGKRHLSLFGVVYAGIIFRGGSEGG